ncbi:hypothetical protein JCM11641_002106 [Rhodosporidiobolus odoratus]
MVRATTTAASRFYNRMATVSATLLTLEDTKTIFAFGDSYSATGYDPSLGYDPFSQNLTTSSGGPIWLAALSEFSSAPYTLANNTFIFARGGATLLPNATFTCYPNMSLSNQVDIFERWFTNGTDSFLEEQEELGGAPTWNSEETLFSTSLVRNNDLKIAYKRDESWSDSYSNANFDELDVNIQRLYSLGARHFLVHEVPPYQLTPLVSQDLANDPAAHDHFSETVPLWNELLTECGATIREKYEGASAVVWEAQAWFEAILSDPLTFGFTNSTDYCDAYASEIWSTAANSTAFVESCEVPLSEYVWLDRIHPTWSLHELLGNAVATSLSPSEGLPLSSPDSAKDADDLASALGPTDPSAIVPIPVIAPSAVSPNAIDPSLPDPVSIPLDPNAGVGYSTLPNGDTIPTGVTWAKRLKKRTPQQQQQHLTTYARASWRTRTQPSSPPSGTAQPRVPVVPVNPNEGVAHSTLPDGDTITVGKTWTRKAKRAVQGVDGEAGGAAAEASGGKKKERFSWRTHSVSRATHVPSSSHPTAPAHAPLVPIDPNAGMAYTTLPSGDTLPIGKIWAREKREHVEKRAREGEGDKGFRKVGPVMVNEEVGKKEGKVKRNGFWKEVRQRFGESVVAPGAVGVA